MVTVIVPARNAEKTIARCIHSIFQNKSKQIECITIVNDSCDRTLDICRQLQKKYLSLRVYVSQQKGVSNARNLGLDLAKGDIIGFCDADDFYEPGAIDYVLQAVKKYAFDILVTAYYQVVYRKNKRVRRSYRDRRTPRIVSLKEARRRMLSDRSVMGSVWNKFYRREILPDCRFDTGLTHCEDLHFNMVVLRQDKLKIVISNVLTYDYVNNSEGATTTKELLFASNGRLKYYDAMDKIAEQYSDNKNVLLDIRAMRAVLGVENYEFASFNPKIQQLLRQEVLKNGWSFLCTFYERGVRTNVKYFIQGILVLLNAQIML